MYNSYCLYIIPLQGSPAQVYNSHCLYIIPLHRSPAHMYNSHCLCIIPLQGSPAAHMYNSYCLYIISITQEPSTDVQLLLLIHHTFTREPITDVQLPLLIHRTFTWEPSTYVQLPLLIQYAICSQLGKLEPLMYQPASESASASWYILPANTYTVHQLPDMWSTHPPVQYKLVGIKHVC